MSDRRDSPSNPLKNQEQIEFILDLIEGEATKFQSFALVLSRVDSAEEYDLALAGDALEGLFDGFMRRIRTQMWACLPLRENDEFTKGKLRVVSSHTATTQEEIAK